MYILKLATFVSIMLMIIISVDSQAATARSKPACGSYNYTITCYGGVIDYDNDGQELADTSLYQLILTADYSLQSLEVSWEPIASTHSFELETRAYPQNAMLSDGRLLVSGGFNSKEVKGAVKRPQNLVYNVQSRSWSTYPEYQVNGISKTIYSATTVAVPGKGVAFFGGYEHNVDENWAAVGGVTVSPNSTKGAFRNVGYTELTYFDIDNINTPWNTPSQTAPTPYTALQTAVYYEKDKRIYFFGGNYIATPSILQNIRPQFYNNFSSILYFDVETDQWGHREARGTDIPSVRVDHTTTILPKNPDIMILYGGEYDEKVVVDYYYTLDLTTFTWSRKFISSTDGNTLQRTKHAAVLVDDNTLFLVFGYDGTDSMTRKPIILDISNPTDVKYSSAYTYSPDGSSGSDGRDGKSSNKKESDKGIGTGSIVGIVVGVLVLIAIAAFIFIRRKNQKKKEENENEKVEKSGKQKSITSSEPLEVDWDQIEKTYQEVPGIMKYDAPHTQTPDGTTTVFSVGSDPAQKSAMAYSVSGSSQTPDGIVRLQPSAPNAYKPDGAGY